MVVSFQFHLVRLKVCLCAKGLAFGKEFQFHLVRLKAANVPNGSPSVAFQFHLVRLKVFNVKKT